jgi:iron(III) transport system substrate-binding protein
MHRVGGRRRQAGVVAVLAAVALAMTACSSSTGTTTGNGGNSSGPGTSDSTSGGSAGTSSGASSGTSSGASQAAAKGDRLSVTAEQACAAATASEGGQLTYWAETDPDIFAKEIKPFQEKYPGIKIDYSSLRPSDIVQRVISEAQANHPLSVDAVAGSLSDLQTLLDQKLVTSVDFAKLGVPADDLIQQGDVSVYRVYRDPQGLAYNKDLVKPEDLPNTWAELVDPKWAGKIIADPSARYLAGLSLAWGEDKAVSWLQDFMKTGKPMVLKGATASMQKVSTGEALATTSATYSAYGPWNAKGAPIGFKYLDLVPTFEYYAMVLKGAKHPNAAACFLSWLSTPEAMDQQLQLEYKQNLSVPKGVPDGAKVVSVTSAADAALTADAATKMAKILGGS